MNCEKCGNPKSEIVLFQFTDWICKICENAAPYTYKIEYSEVPYSNHWRSLEKCFEDAGRQFPFEIEFLSGGNIYNKNNPMFMGTKEDFIVVSKSARGWDTKSKSFWGCSYEETYRLYKGEK